MSWWRSRHSLEEFMLNMRHNRAKTLRPQPQARTQLCSCCCAEDVLSWFFCCWSLSSDHMTSRCTVMSEGHGKWVSWDRTSSLVLCKGEEPCLGLFVFPALSPTAGHPRPAATVATSLSLGPTALPAASAPVVFYLQRAKCNLAALPIHLLTWA